MSGGSYDYFYSRIEEFANRIECTTPLRKAFRMHLLDVAEAAHDIEWVDDSDYGEGDEVAAIEKVLGKNVKVLVLEEAVKDAQDALKQLQGTIEKAKEV
jgi:hypothetical protein